VTWFLDRNEQPGIDIATIIDAYTVLTTNHITGQVIDGRITLRGHATLGSWKSPSHITENTFQELYIDGSVNFSELTFDEPKQQHPKRIRCLALSLRDPSEGVTQRLWFRGVQGRSGACLNSVGQRILQARRVLFHGRRSNLEALLDTKRDGDNDHLRALVSFLLLSSVAV
jgi:hypothetical protein